MISSVLSGQAVWLANQAPNTDTIVRLSVSIPVDLQRSLTGGSSRRPEALSPRYSLEWSAGIRATGFAALRNATMAAQDEPVLVPAWPFAWRVGIDTPVITAGLVVAWMADWSTWAFNPGSLAAFDFAAPVIFGRFASPARLAARNDDLVVAEFSLDEDSPAGYGFAPAGGLLSADLTLATAGGFAAPVFPFVHEGSTLPAPGLAVVDVTREAIGPGRQKLSSFYPQAPELLHQATYKTRTAAEAARLLAWWIRRAGITEPHWVPTSQKIGFLAADAGAGSTTLNFATLAPLGNVPAVALYEPGQQIEYARITNVAGNVVTLAAGLGRTWGRYSTVVSPAFFGRHTDQKLVMEFRRGNDGYIGSTQLNWREVASEYNPPAWETRGVTLGRLPSPAWFFQIDLDYNGALISTYLTNWESGATVNGQYWTYNPCDFDEITQSDDLEDDGCTFRAKWWDGGPWENWQPGMLAARGYITIYRADVDASGNFSNFTQFMHGELDEPKFDGPLVQQKVLGSNAMFSQLCPNRLVNTTCGTFIYRPRCGLLKANWSFNATVASVVGNVLTIGSISRANGTALPSGFGSTGWFYLGWIEWTSGATVQRSDILASTAIAGGLIALTVDRSPGLVAGAAVVAVRGCDLQSATCTLLGNHDNFQGFENKPAISPNFILPQAQTTSSKKS